MNSHRIKFLLFTVFVIQCVSCFSKVYNGQYNLLIEPFTSYYFSKPIDFLYPDKRFAYVLEQRGKIWTLDLIHDKKILSLDISHKLGRANEEGLLGGILDPNFTDNHFIYLYYTKKNHEIILSRFLFKDAKIILDSEKIFLKILNPYSNHNGGQLAFDKKGFLYVGIGDGGSRGDPQNNAQNLESLLGKIIQIDVSRYNNSPFRLADKAVEIYAYGLRNPWTFSFDKQSGQIICADVGQGTYEEINLIHPKANYGWRIWEGTKRYKPTDFIGNKKFIKPIIQYKRDWGYSVVGGYVYRGSRIKSLFGIYLYTDFYTGNLAGFKLDKKANIIKSYQFFNIPLRISRFAQAYDNELYFCSFKKGRIFKIIDMNKGISPKTNK